MGRTARASQSACGIRPPPRAPTTHPKPATRTISSTPQQPAAHPAHQLHPARPCACAAHACMHTRMHEHRPRASITPLSPHPRRPPVVLHPCNGVGPPHRARAWGAWGAWGAWASRGRVHHTPWCSVGHGCNRPAGSRSARLPGGSVVRTVPVCSTPTQRQAAGLGSSG